MVYNNKNNNNKNNGCGCCHKWTDKNGAVHMANISGNGSHSCTIVTDDGVTTSSCSGRRNSNNLNCNNLNCNNLNSSNVCITTGNVTGSNIIACSSASSFQNWDTNKKS